MKPDMRLQISACTRRGRQIRPDPALGGPERLSYTGAPSPATGMARESAVRWICSPQLRHFVIRVDRSVSLVVSIQDFRDRQARIGPSSQKEPSHDTCPHTWHFTLGAQRHGYNASHRMYGFRIGPWRDRAARGDEWARRASRPRWKHLPRQAGTRPERSRVTAEVMSFPFAHVCIW